MDSRFIKKIKLENGLTMKILDSSRPVAGDRWQVVFEIQIDVALRPEYFSDPRLSDVDFEDALSLLGNSTNYHYKKERNFIADNQTKSVLENMEIDFLKTNLSYLSSPKFPIGLILGNYQKALSKRILSERQKGKYKI